MSQPAGGTGLAVRPRLLWRLVLLLKRGVLPPWPAQLLLGPALHSRRLFPTKLHHPVPLPWGFHLGLARGWLSGKESACQCRRYRRLWFDPWVGKIPWCRQWQPTPVFLLGKSHGQSLGGGCRPWGHKEWIHTRREALADGRRERLGYYFRFPPSLSTMVLGGAASPLTSLTSHSHTATLSPPAASSSLGGNSSLSLPGPECGTVPCGCPQPHPHL